MGTNCFNSYKINPTDCSFGDVRRNEQFFNMQEYYPVVYDRSYLNLMNDILATRKIVSNSTIGDYAYDRSFILNSIRLWDELGIRLRSIPILTYRYDINRFRGYATPDLVNATMVGDVGQVPMYFVPGGLENAKVHTFNVNVFGVNRALAYNIILPQMHRRAISAVYAHEVTHLQLYNAGGGARKITNDETLPIFMEEVAANMIDDTGDTFRVIRNNRLHHIAKSLKDLNNAEWMSYYNKMKLDDYIISGIQGINLANIYHLGDYNLKREMIRDLDRVFNGYMVTEDILDKYDSNIDDIPKKVRSLTRYKR